MPKVGQDQNISGELPCLLCFPLPSSPHHQTMLKIFHGDMRLSTPHSECYAHTVVCLMCFGHSTLTLFAPSPPYDNLLFSDSSAHRFNVVRRGSSPRSASMAGDSWNWTNALESTMTSATKRRVNTSRRTNSARVPGDVPQW